MEEMLLLEDKDSKEKLVSLGRKYR